MDKQVNSFLSENIVLKVKLVVYCVLTVFSLFVVIGISVMKDEHYGYCYLFFDKDNEGEEKIGPDSNCDYPLAIAIIFQMFYTLYRLVTLVLLLLGKLQKTFILFSDIVELMYSVVDTIAFLLMFIGAIILSAGHNAACDPQCGENRAYSAAKAAQAGAWMSTIVWLFVAIVGFLFLWRSGKLPCLHKNKGDQPATRGKRSKEKYGTSNPAATTEDEARPEERPNDGNYTKVIVSPAAAATEDEARPEERPKTGNYPNVTVSPEERPKTGNYPNVTVSPEDRPKTGNYPNVTVSPEERPKSGNFTVTPVVRDVSLWPNPNDFSDDEDDTYNTIDMDC